MVDLKNAKIEDFCSKIIDQAGKDTNLLEVSHALKESGHNHMPIVEDGEFVGIITDRDLKLIAGMQREDELSAGDIMHKSIYVVSGDTSLNEVVGQLLDKKLDCALIKLEDGLGIFTSGDGLKIIKDASS